MALEFTDSNFQEEVLDSTIPVVVDFYADWCGPCKVIGPTIDELYQEYDGKAKIGKIDIDQNRAIATKYEVMSIPTILFIKNGEVVDTIMGAVPKATLEEKLTAML